MILKDSIESGDTDVIAAFLHHPSEIVATDDRREGCLQKLRRKSGAPLVLSFTLLKMAGSARRKLLKF